MPFTLTTLSAAVGVNDTSILIASLTGVSVGSLIGIDNEVLRVGSPLPAAATTPVPVFRGQEGSAQAAHPVSAQVRIGATATALLPADWTQPQPGAAPTAAVLAQYSRDRKSYSAAGAITLPVIGGDMVAVINGTSALAMTIANPSTEQDGSRLTIVGNGKAAHTVTYTAGLGNVGAAADVITFKADQSQAIDLIACGGFWVNTSLVAGAATVAGAGLA